MAKVSKSRFYKNNPLLCCPTHFEAGDGLRLRDLFAAAALNGMLSESSVMAAPLVAELAYAHADAMLAEREREEGGDG